MRISILAGMPLVAALALTPSLANAQVRATVHLGNAITITNYSPDVYGDWHTNYHKWTPATVYEYNGHYYPHSVRGARQVQVYRSGEHYFLPPQDQAWTGVDKRYNYKHRPNDDDYHRAPQPPHGGH